MLLITNPSKPATGYAILFLTCIALFYSASSYYDGDIGQDGGSSLVRRRLLGISEYQDPKSKVARSVADTKSSLPTIHFYIKSSGQAKYLDRSKRIAKSWAKETNGMITFLLDHHNTENVIKFGQEHPWVSVSQIYGTDRQGEYKGGGDKNEAHHAQRIKTRVVFTEFDALNLQPEWVCYLDDDMDVHVSTLKEDLVRLQPRCTPECWIGDTYRGKAAAGGWCMQRALAERVGDLLNQKTDQDLGWIGTDDGGFSGYVMHGRNGLQPGVDIIDSDWWYSEFHRPIPADDPKRSSTYHLRYPLDSYKKVFHHTKVLTPQWTKDKEFMDKWLPTAAVYNAAYKSQA